MPDFRPWRLDAKCVTLLPSQADLIFFPGSGGKPTRAKVFCSTCPVQSNCLKESIELKLDGFMCGTTPDERATMRDKFHYSGPTLIEQINDILPECAKVKIKTVYRKFAPSQPDTLTYLDSLSGPPLLK